MAQKKTHIDKAADRLATIAERHLSGLPEPEQAKRLRAFKRVVAKVGDSRAKSAELHETAGSVLKVR